MTVNLTAKPYYDDYDSQKNFYRILFKPGVPVQARELTQLQTILQDQIKKFANHIFVDGTRVSKENPQAVIIDQQNYFASKILNTNSANIASYVGLYVTGEITETIGLVEFAFDRNNPTIGDPDTIVFKRVKGTGNFNSGEVLYFYDNVISANILSDYYIDRQTTETDFTVYTSASVDSLSDEITIISKTDGIKSGDYVSYQGITDLYVVDVISDNLVRVNKNLDITGTALSINFIRKATSKTCVVSLSDATYYKNGFFINVPAQQVVPQKYTPYPTKSVIYKYTDEIINYDADLSLLDPAFGHSNYLAPGADRLKISLVLDTVDLTSTYTPDTSIDYIELVRFVRGNYSLIYSSVSTQYAALGDALAERTYNESGNYVIDQFTVKSSGSSSSGASNRFIVGKGHAVIGGYDIKTADKTEIIIPKAQTTKTELQTDISTYYGNYLLIDAPSYGLYDPEQITNTNFWECHSTTNRNAMSNTSTLVGYIIPKMIKYDSGSGSNVAYRLNWYDYTQISSSLSFSNVRSIISVSNNLTARANNNGTYANPLFFANVSAIGISNTITVTGWTSSFFGVGFPTLAVTPSPMVFETASPDRLIFETGKAVVKDVNNVSILYQRLYSNVVLSAGYGTITTSSPNKFVGIAGATLPTSFARPYYSVVVKEKLDSLTLSGWTNGAFVPLENLTLSVDSSQRQLTIRHSNSYVSAKVDILVTLENDTLSKRSKTLVTNQASVIYMDKTQNTYSLYKSDIYSLKNIYRIGSSNWAGTYNSSTTYAINSAVQYGDKVYISRVSTSNSIGDPNYWTAVIPDPLSLYTLDDGQRDSYYDWGGIINLTERTADIGYVVVIYDYFTHGGTGVLDVTSYPASLYSRIPNYRSTVDSRIFNLRDCLDYRPRREDKVGTGVDLWTSTVVPKPDPLAVPGTQADVEYYLPRIDQLYLNTRDASPADPGNKFSIRLGTPDVNPKVLSDDSDKSKQLLATFVSPPYTASANDVKIIYNSKPRYTMTDIGTLDSRLGVLEKKVKKQGIEIVALNNKVFDRSGTTGNVLYSTGIFIEDFSSLSSGLITDPHFTVAINTSKKEARPSFSAVSHRLFFTSVPTISYTDDIISMPYTEETLIDQTKPSGVSIVTYAGSSSTDWLGLIMNASTLYTIATLDYAAIGAAYAAETFYSAGVGAALESAFGQTLLGEGIALAGEVGAGSALAIGIAEVATIVIGEVSGISAGAWILSFFFGACFKENTKIKMADGSSKNIKDVNIGDLVFNHNCTKINKVSYITKGRYEGKLYSPDKNTEEFITELHPLIMDGALVHPEPEQIKNNFPWLGKCDLLNDVKHKDISNETVYNLYVDGDGTYTVNGFGTTSIYSNGGSLARYFVNENISKENKECIFDNYRDLDKNEKIGWYHTNIALGKIGSPKLDKLFVNSTSKNSPIKRKITLSFFKIIGSITKVIKGQ